MGVYCVLIDVLNSKASLGNDLRTAHEFSGGIHRWPLAAYANQDKEAQVEEETNHTRQCGL